MQLFRVIVRMMGMDDIRCPAVVLSQDNHGLPTPAELGALTDAALISALDAAAAGERESLCHLLKYLAEVESRGIHLDMGYRTVFDFCVLRLKLSEGAAMRRIYSARAAVKVPELYGKLRSGELSLSSVSRLAPHLTTENSRDLIARASGARLREVETIVAELAYKEARPIPEPKAEASQAELSFVDLAAAPAGSAETPAGSAEAPGGATEAEVADPPDQNLPEAHSEGGKDGREDLLGPGESALAVQPSPPPRPPTPPREGSSLKRDSIHVEAPGVIRYVFRSRPALLEKLELAARLLGRRPDGRLEILLDLVLERFLEKEDPFRRKARAARRSKKRARRVARAVRDAVWRRDGGRCAFVSPEGVRCEALTKLEYDHIVPWALGGASDDPANIRLLCRPHNLQRARATFGDRVPPGLS